ncbi:MAG: succinate dehydrogenase assembly factor 2 [Cardiobacteriaceae bacterium]|nr:succinate dehydrogenase assembly factor 2 [Cardiobacteriaceae bacterium]
MEDKRIKWLCRRGMKELDLLMETYFANNFPKQSDKRQQAFLKLLEYQDPTIVDLLFKRIKDEDEEINNLISELLEIKIRNSAND